VEFTKRFKLGLDVGLVSFGLLWKNKKLSIYIGTPILIGILIELITFNIFHFAPAGATIFLHGIMARIWESFGWSRYIGLLLTEFVKQSATIFASVALTYHVVKIIKRSKASIRRSIILSFAKIKPIVTWSAISTISFFFIHSFDRVTFASVGTPGYLSTILWSITIRVTWSLATLFVITRIALEEYPLKKIVIDSPTTTKKMFPEYLGAILWVALIGALAFLPFVLFQVKNQLVLTLSYVVITLIGITLSTVHTILKTILYRQYKGYKKNS